MQPEEYNSPNPEDTPLYRSLTGETKKIIQKKKEKGLVYEPKSRWDLQDQQAYDEVPIEILLDDPYYGGGKYYAEQIDDELIEHQGLWPAHRQDLLTLWEWRRKYGTDTYVAIEGIGSGKTHKFRAALRLDLMYVLTRVNPLEYFNLDPKGQGISFVCMSKNAKLAKEVTFNTVLKGLDCPFFNDYFPPQVNLTQLQGGVKPYPSVLRFPKDVVIFPGSGSALSAIGYNLFGGGIDEANYLDVVEGSKKAVLGTEYDAAELMYNAIYARMKSRFVSWIKKKGRLPGLLMLFSNMRHSTDFLERMTKKARQDRRIFCSRRPTWEGHPDEHFSGKKFLFDYVNRCIVDSDGRPLSTHELGEMNIVGGESLLV